MKKNYHVYLLLICFLSFLFSCSKENITTTIRSELEESPDVHLASSRSNSTSCTTELFDVNVKVMSFNVKLGLPGDGGHDNKQLRLIRIRDLISGENPDIIGFQEAFEDKSYGLWFTLKSFLRDEGYYVTETFKGTTGLDINVKNSGVFIASKYPIFDVSFEDFETLSGALNCGNDDFATKGFIFGRIKVGTGAYINVFNTHFDAGSCNGDFVARQEQAQQIKDARNWLTRDGGPILYLGDFNTNFLDPSPAGVDRYNNIEDRLRADPSAVLAGLNIVPPTKEDGAKLDYIFVGRDGSLSPLSVSHYVIEDPDENISDHYAVFSDLHYRLPEVFKIKDVTYWGYNNSNVTAYKDIRETNSSHIVWRLNGEEVGSSANSFVFNNVENRDFIELYDIRRGCVIDSYEVEIDENNNGPL